MGACTFTRSRQLARVGPAALLASLMAVSGVIASSGGAQAESAWVRGEVRLNVRTGPGTKFRIVNGVKTGDHVQIQDRMEDWIKVGLDSGETGWIPKGYLAPEPPATLKLEQLEVEAAQLRETVAANASEIAELKRGNGALALRDEEQRLEIDQLRRENTRLKANARWPEWITGAGIVCGGMIVGAILQRSSGRRNTSRLRL